MFESRLVAQCSFGDNMPGCQSVPRWRNGKRSGPRPRGLDVAVGVRLSLSGPDHTTASGRRQEGYRSVRTYRRKLASLAENTPKPFFTRDSVRTGVSRLSLQNAWGGGRAGGPGFDSRQAVPHSEGATRPNAVRSKMPSRILRVIAFQACGRGFESRRIFGIRSSVVERIPLTRHALGCFAVKPGPEVAGYRSAAVQVRDGGDSVCTRTATRPGHHQPITARNKRR